MRSHLSLLVLVSLVVLTACAPAGPTEAESEAAMQADIDALDQLRSDYEAAYNAQDAAAVAGFYTDDAVRSLPNQEPTSGRDAIQSNLQATLDQAEAEISIPSEEIQVAGDWAFGAGTYSLKLTPKEEGGEATARNGSYIVILKRQADGCWKIARVVDSSNDPLPGAEE
ncbi:SgcJ/EcaC family oxidoreductase [Acidobacteria bacterium AH-259-L09]|nr:SgcJ/EcaC family oxidoreductase [Acidobacteria bacterium AH-259-L09]